MPISCKNTENMWFEISILILICGFWMECMKKCLQNLEGVHNILYTPLTLIFQAFIWNQRTDIEITQIPISNI